MSHMPAPPLTELRMLTWLGLTILLEHSLYSSAMELFFMMTEPPRLSKRLLEGDAASALCMPLDYLFLTLVIMRRSGEKGLIGEGGSTELRWRDACDAFFDYLTGECSLGCERRESRRLRYLAILFKSSYFAF